MLAVSGTFELQSSPGRATQGPHKEPLPRRQASTTSSSDRALGSRPRLELTGRRRPSIIRCKGPRLTVMAKENEHDSTKRRESQTASGRIGTQDRKESGRGETQFGRRKREAHQLPQRRGSAGDSPGFQPSPAYGRGKAQPPGRIHGARPLQIA